MVKGSVSSGEKVVGRAKRQEPDVASAQLGKHAASGGYGQNRSLIDRRKISDDQPLQGHHGSAFAAEAS
jgi:hypothetical protein